MIFTSFEFVCFFLFVVCVRTLIRNFGAEKWFLVVVSYVFYMSWSIPCGLLILFTSLFDYVIGLRLGVTENTVRRKLLMAASLVVNLGMLGFFKYTNFLLENLQWGLGSMGMKVNPWHYEILLPVGISFFTFQSMSYTIDVYRRQLEPCRSARDFLLFVSFFPQLVAGPIVRAIDFLPQLARRVRPTLLDFETGLAQFLLGAVKKIVISDQVASHVDLIFANPGQYDGLTLLQGALGYAVQIYCDFSGYSDMAIGAARMMGFTFLENFQMPYSSVNITEFWRRWHISLSSWFRDYLYIPLGGNRKGVSRTYANLLITMFLCGLWHGASWNFVFWGVLHGVCLAVHRVWKNADPLKGVPDHWLLRILGNVASRGLTLGIVLVGWVFFRAQTWDGATDYLGRMLTLNPDGLRLWSPYILPAVFAVFAVHLVFPKDGNWSHSIPQASVPVRVAAYSVLFILLALLGAVDAAPFIYFQF